MLARLRKYFFSGLAVFLPFVLTVSVCVWALNFAESILGRYLRPFFLDHYDFYFWGFGILVLMLLILLCGFVGANYFGRAMQRMTERIVLKIPLMGSIYPAFKEIAGFLFKEESSRRPQQVVMVEWPCKGMYMIAFLTNQTSERIAAITGKKLFNVMIPHVPNPLVGFVVMVPEEDIVPLPISIEEAVRIIVSGGVVNSDAADSPKN